jgi:hypothetical protein
VSLARAQRPIAMNPRRLRPPRRAQRGVALLIFLAIMMAAVFYGLFSSLNEATATVPLQRSQQNAEVLKQAKDALIARAATDLNRPGSLPCPDTNNNGSAETLVGSSCPAYLGRLPWRTLGLPDLRDGAGERLWYAFAQAFTDDNSRVINSDARGDLTVEGTSNAAEVVAIVFAPGAVVGAQNRQAGPNAAANYLEAVNPYVANWFLAMTRCEQVDCVRRYSGGVPLNGAYNDQLIVITHEDLLRAVEEEARRRIDRDLVPRMSDYWTGWRTTLGLGANAIVMPYAAPYIDATATPADPTRAQNLYRGAAAQTVGLLPLTRDDDPNPANRFLVWDRPSVVVETRSPPGPWGPAPLAAPVPSDPIIDLNIDVNHDGLNRFYRVTARLRNVGLTFALPIATPTPGGFFSSPTLAQSFDASGNLDVIYTVAVTGAPAAPLTLFVPRTSTFSAVTDPSPAEVQWFFDNRWYRHVLYAASPGVVTGAPGLTGTCVAPPGTPACVVVESARPADARTDARFALVLAGRNVKLTPRTWTLADYFEGKNAAATGAAVLEQKLRGPQFNDKVVVR